VRRRIVAVTGTPFGQHAVTSARLFSGPPVGSKHEARKLAAGGHLKELYFRWQRVRLKFDSGQFADHPLVQDTELNR
jgi:hypothetical protein